MIMKNLQLSLLLIIMSSGMLYSQYTAEDSVKWAKWITITSNPGGIGPQTGKIVQIASAERYIEFFPLNEIALWLCTDLYCTEDRKLYFVMSHIRFSCITGKFVVTATYEYQNSGPDYVEVPNSKYNDEWKELFAYDTTINKEVFKFARKQFE